MVLHVSMSCKNDDSLLEVLTLTAFLLDCLDSGCDAPYNGQSNTRRYVYDCPIMVVVLIC